MRGFVWEWAYHSYPARPEQAQLAFLREPMVGAGAVRPAAPCRVGRGHFRAGGQARSRRPRANLSPTLDEDETKIERVQRGERASQLSRVSTIATILVLAATHAFAAA